MNYIIRKLNETEVILLDDFIYEAIFISHGVEAPPRSIIMQQDLQVYIKDSGKRHMINALLLKLMIRLLVLFGCVL